jgi:membrane protein
LGKAQRRMGEFELMVRAMNFAALGLVTLIPLLIVIAAAIPVGRAGFADWLVDRLSLSGAAAVEVRDLFVPPGRVLSSTTAFNLAVLAASGTGFVSTVQAGFERVWGLPPGPWHTALRRVTWLAGLVGYVVFTAVSPPLLRPLPAGSALLGAVTSIVTIAFFWWTPRELLGGRIGWRQLCPGAIATAIGLAGLHGFSALFFSALVESNRDEYGVIGVVLVLLSWMVGAGVVVFGGAVVGRLLVEEPPAALRRLLPCNLSEQAATTKRHHGRDQPSEPDRRENSR